MSGAWNLKRIVFLLPLAALAGTAFAADKSERYGKNPENLETHLDRLVAAYPETIQGFDKEALTLRDGTRLPLSDGRENKSFDELLNDPDIGDMFAFDYPAGAKPSQPPRNFDPGRIRNEALFRALYGDCDKGEVTPRMQNVSWVPAQGGGQLSFNAGHGAAKALAAVSRELETLSGDFAKYLVPSAGTYNCRAIAGTNRQSMHGYGVAIDINTEYSAYWQWAKPGADGLHKWTNRIPAEIVEIFEKHGFIWGGRWYHYDTMHFEYRPDLVGESATKKAG
jgi:hypothetical protein